MMKRQHTRIVIVDYFGARQKTLGDRSLQRMCEEDVMNFMVDDMSKNEEQFKGSYQGRTRAIVNCECRAASFDAWHEQSVRSCT